MSLRVSLAVHMMIGICFAASDIWRTRRTTS